MVAGSLSSVQSCLGQTDHYANYVINIEGQVFFPVNFAELLIMRTEELTSLMGQTNCCGRGQQEGPAVCTAQHCGPLGKTMDGPSSMPVFPPGFSYRIQLYRQRSASVRVYRILDLVFGRSVRPPPLSRLIFNFRLPIKTVVSQAGQEGTRRNEIWC